MKGSESHIRTNVGCAGHDQNFLRGMSVRDELLGRVGYLGALTVGIGGPHLSPDTEHFLNDLSVAILAPDPRIWPLKSVWLVGAYGSYAAAVAVASLFQAESRMGDRAIVEVAEQLLQVGSWPEDERAERWRRHVSERRIKRKLLPGFGVPGRAVDERVSLVKDCVRKHHATERRFYQSFLMIERAQLAEWNLPANASGVLVAALLDLDCTASQIAALVEAMVSVSIRSNAFAAVGLKPRLLRRLPCSSVKYHGLSRRASPRCSSPRDSP